ncbi:hypothetical protein HOP50_15g74800 [Chloropicon primus]|uniref:Coiled-coil domain-containing protein 61 n=1 Tax=Chloropicon primus TaxID=1764295 RepID=A0A5B8MWT1_9CHLO|nr:hypothetical protein A3770_15p74550 [Chloropicon primus]UPR04146.1 hypothetical protein HOP50_15g74800 [Chloropicon primus]|eukprot:QDZ24937.1 hypothetical protein A3770_15p74550 [Chloropicon primus]
MICTESVEREFGENFYQVTVSAHKGDTVSVEAELLDSGERWRGDFSSKYIEDITTKTGNFKKYSVFVKMLFSSLNENSSSVFLDLLTYEDLESLKSRAGATSRTDRASTGNRRYIILTYAAEFDRVHYPLPLLYEDPDPDLMRETILKLRQEIQGLRARSLSSSSTFSLKAENRHLREENGNLKAQMQRAIRSEKSDSYDELSTQLKLVKRERNILQTRLEALEDDLERIRSSHRKVLKKKDKEHAVLADENAKCRASNRDLRSRNRALESELDVLRSKRHRVRSASPRAAPTHPSSAAPKPRPSYANPTRSSSRSARTSREPSPYSRTSREASPYSRTTSSQSNRPPSGASSRNSSVERGRSKTPRKRFDPTAYVLEQRAKLEARRNRSRMSTPTNSRPSSRNNSRPTSRASSGRSTPTHQSGSKAKPSPQARPANRRSARQRLPLSNESSYVSSRRTARESSPGRVLHDVQTKLDEYVNKQRGKEEMRNSKGSAPPSPGKKIMNDASQEIEDIDTRLQALQHFLSNVRVDGRPPST